MGWYFSNGTRENLIRELIEPRNDERVRAEVLAYSLRGNVLWSVIRVTAKETRCGELAPGETSSYIRCDLLQRSGQNWSYKPLEESMHPYYYTCPLRYLKMAPVKCAEWRKRVRAYHQTLKAKRQQADVIKH